MILVDSSVWIDYFNGTQSRETDILDNRLGVDFVVVGDLILAEVLQGFRSEEDFQVAKELLTDLGLIGLVGVENAVIAADTTGCSAKRE